MNTLDIVIVLLFIPGIIRGLTKGLLEQAVSLGGIVLGVFLAQRFGGAAGSFIGRFVHVSETMLNVVGFVAILVLVLIGVILLAKLVTQIAKMASLGWLNRSLGLIFSLGVTAVVLAVLIILFDTVNLKFGLVKSPVLDESVLYGYLKDFGYWVFPYLKQLFQAAGTEAASTTTAFLIP